ncbi:hypothetical protein [Streptomyces sp. NBC_01465]|uniref:hypothetical protein n=1 Tax=Streptomyces sp. NBC_01465 TaxID=2903878 RepID=UPI002E36CD96|nr:hypothetical protein [Streptomyces sp. NBC_01465]
MTDEAPPIPPAGTVSIRRLGTLFGAVAAPTTFVTALLYFFGYFHAYWFFDYFGINSTVLGLSTVDYLLRSQDALFVPMTVTAAAVLAAFWAYALLRTQLAFRARPEVLRIAVPAVAGAGLLLSLGGFWSVLAPTFLNDHLVAAPLSLASGVVLLGYALHLNRVAAAAPPAPAPDPARDDDTDDTPSVPPPPEPPRAARPGWADTAEWAVLFVLVGLSLFWAASDYASAVGRTRAQQFVAGMPAYPTTVLYSARALSIEEPGVHETRCRNPKSAYPYRYDGLKLMLNSADQYVFLPQGWTPTTGSALLIPRTDTIRLEFLPPYAVPPPAC